MKASELMLNDWVQHKGSPYRVCMITDIGVVTADDGICHFHFISKYLSPIPLTEDILVKNGFGKVNNQYFFGQVEIKELRDCWVVTINKEDADIDINIHYVHQLQHLLRLVGIEKEIEL